MKVLALAVCLLHSALTVIAEPGSFEATALFVVTANSTCEQDPPTTFGDGAIFNCSSEDHPVMYALDRDSNTWWQSRTGDDPVTLAFSLIEPTVSLTLTGIRLMVLNNTFPQYYLLELHGRNLDYSEQVVYVNDQASCEGVTLPCNQFSVEDNVIYLPFIANMSQPIAEIFLVLNGFQSMEDNYYTLVEVDIYAQVASGFYAKSLDNIQVEGESGIIQATSLSVPRSSDSFLYPRFSGRGFASLNYSQSENVVVQWVFSLIPSSIEYQVIFKYTSHDHINRRRSVNIMQGDRNFGARVTFLAGCTACTAFLTSSDASQVERNANFSLTRSMATLTVSFSSVDISLDAIVAIPQLFYDPVILDDPASFLSMCNVTSGLLIDAFCLQSALQLSIEFYRSTYECLCMSEEHICQKYGGQCECFEATLMGFSSPVGRQCELCPFYNYYSINGCKACTCPDQFDDCNHVTGECLGCLPLSFGIECENCIPNSYMDTNFTCKLCECDPIGSVSCNQSSGQCICKDGVAGDSCEYCDVGYFNYSISGCTQCECGLGSTDNMCDDFGQCPCTEGASGLKCSNCSVGFYSASSEGCLLCFCSNRTNQCSLLSNTTRSEVCDCPFPFTGMSCENCLRGYYYSETSDLCEQCDCNGRAEECTDGSGECIDCNDNSTGLHCELCIEGMYDEDLSPDLSCQLCPCPTLTTTNDSCTTDEFGQPFCHCLPGHVGHLCDTCSSGYFGMPPETRCTDCSCNGNIDPSIPGSCDSLTGRCLSCINNSTGPECELCQSGYFGNASNQNCQLCECDGGGSIDSTCDRNSGQCTCQEGVTGARCDQCQEGFWNLSSRQGCQQCNCSEASNSSSCDILTGQCLCKYGVEGLSCSSCIINGFYNYSADGCSECNCDVGSFNNSCSDDGLCFCLPGVIGAKCDQCLPFYSTLSSSGCQPCAGCESMLVLALSRAESTINSTQQNYSLFLTLMSIDLVSNLMVNSSLWNLIQMKSAVVQTLDIINTDLNGTDLDSVIFYSLTTEAQVENTLLRTAVIQPRSVAVQDQVLDVHRMMQEVFVDTGSVGTQISATSSRITTQANDSEKVKANITSHIVVDLSPTLYLHTLSSLHSAQTSTDTLVRLSVRQQNQTGTLILKYASLDISILLPQLSSLRGLIDQLEDGCVTVSTLSAQLSSRVESAIDAIFAANDLFSKSGWTIARAQMLLLLATGDIQKTTQIIGNGEFTGSGESGSGGFIIILEEPVLKQPENVASAISNLGYAVEKLARLVLLQEVEVIDASDTSFLIQAAQRFNDTLTQALEQGNIGIGAIQNFSLVLNVLKCTRSLSNETNIALRQAMLQSNILMEKHQNSALVVVDISNQLTYSSQNLSSDITKLITSISTSAVMQEGYAVSNTIRLNSIVTQLTLDVTSHQRASNLTVSYVNQTLIHITNSLNLVNDASVQVSSLLSSIFNATSYVFSSVNSTQSTLSSTELTIDAAENPTISALDSIINATSSFSAINEFAETNQIHLDGINTSLSMLRSRLDRALNAAAMIDVALKLYSNISFSYPVSNPSSPSLESISFVFSPEDISSGELLKAEQESTSVVLQLYNGSILMNYGTGVIGAGNGTLQPNQWYQLYATRDENEAVLSLARLPENGSAITVRTAISNPNQSYMLFNGNVIVGGGYVGCLDHLILNQQLISLLTPLDGEVNIDTCGPRIPSEAVRNFGGGVWLFGAGSYIRLSSQQLESVQFEIQLCFRTFDELGLLLFYPDENLMQYLVVYLSEGKVTLDYKLSPLDSKHLESESTYNFGLWYEITILVNGPNITMIVNGTETLFDSSSVVTDSSFAPSDTLFLGGIPSQYSTVVESEIITSSLSGCVRNMQFDGTVVNLEESESDRVDFSGCPEIVERGVRFMGTGRAEFSLNSEVLSNITFAIRTTQLAALIFNFGGFSVSIFHTKLRLYMSDDFIVEVEDLKLSDNTRHTGSILFSSSENSSLVMLIVDGRATASASIPRISMVYERLFVGGTVSVSNFPNFRGCMDSLTVNKRELDFEEAAVLIGISLYGCRAAREQSPSVLPPPPPPIPPPPSAPTNDSVGLSGRNGSFISLQVSENQVLKSFSIILDFVTISSEGLLLYMQGTIYDDFLALQLVSGKLIFSYNLGSGNTQIKSTGSYNDGVLHKVEIQRRFRDGKLIVDSGIEVVTGTSPGPFSSLNINSGYLFLGGVPDMMLPLSLLPIEQQASVPILACFSSLVINGVFEDLDSPQASMGIEKCLTVYNNVVTLQQDSYLLMMDGFDVGVQINISVDFYTNKCSGLLFYVASSIYSDHLLVELRNGYVVLAFDNGPMREVLEYFDGRQFCDGAWHSLLVSKNGLTGMVSVDGNPPQTVASSCDFCQSFFAINTDDPLYVGGIPVTVRHTVESGSFEGCLRNLYVYRDGRKPEALIFSQAQEHENVNFDVCSN